VLIGRGVRILSLLCAVDHAGAMKRPLGEWAGESREYVVKSGVEGVFSPRSNSHAYSSSLEKADAQIGVAVQGKVQETMVLRVVFGELGALVHDEIRWSDCVVVVNHKFIVIQRSSGDRLRKNLTPGQCPR